MISAVLRSAQAGAILTALGLSVGLMTGVAEAKPKPPEPNCPSPFFEDGLNERYKVSERIIGPPGCRVAFVGEPWVRAVPPWLTAPQPKQAVYPDGYVPSKPNPIQDFKEKFEGARYVLDGMEVVTVGKEILQTGSVDKNVANFGGLPFIVPVSPVFEAFTAPGTHTSQVFVKMSARHCNGLPPTPTTPDPGTTPAPGLNQACLPGGEFVAYPIIDNAPFTVDSP